MTEGLKQEAWLDQLKALCPTVDNLRLMLGAARHAFNRHSLAKLEEMARLQDDIILDLDPIFERVEAGLGKCSEGDKPELLKLQGILSHLEFAADSIARLADPIRRKSNHGAIFSDREFFHVNDLFAQETGFMRAVVDIFLYNDASLKAYVLAESQKASDTCFQKVETHEFRILDSPGYHNAWSIYLDILDRFREILGHLREIVNILR